MRTVVILGSSGYIGSMLSSVLRKTCEVYGVDIFPGTETNIICNPINEDLHDKLPDKVDFVINSAAIVGVHSNIPEIDYFLTNSYLPLQAGRYAESSKAHYLFFSTTGVYGYREKAVTEKTHPNPADIYSLSKYLGELNCLHLLNKKNLMIIRLNFPYGPGQQTGVLAGLIRKINNGLPVTLNTKDGRPVISPIQIEDLISLVKIALKKKLFGIYNCGGQEHLSILEISNRIAKLMLKEVKFSLINKPCLNLMCNSEKIYNDCGYKPSVSTNDGLKEAINQYL